MADDARVHQRTDLNATLSLEIIKAENSRELEPFEVEILNLSMGGVGFRCDNQLMIGEMFTGELTIWTKEKFDVVLKVVRSKVEDTGYSYGCIFVGLKSEAKNSIMIYQMVNDSDK